MRRYLLLAALLSSAPLALVGAGAAGAHGTDAAAAAGAGAGAGAPVAKEKLLKPPADAVHYVVVSESGKHGDQWRWRLPDGRLAYRWSQSLRGWITEMDQVTTLAADGTIQALTVRGVTMTGDAAEQFGIDKGQARWTSASDSGNAAAGGFYIPAGGVSIANAPLADKLAAAGAAGVKLLPSGKAVMSLGPTATIKGPNGPKTVQLAFVRGITAAPNPVWLDENKRYFAEIGHISVIPAGYEGALKPLRDAQDAATASEVKAVAARFLTPAAKAPVLFDNVQLFDADKGRFVANQAVLAQNGKIAAIALTSLAVAACWASRSGLSAPS